MNRPISLGALISAIEDSIDTMEVKVPSADYYRQGAMDDATLSYIDPYKLIKALKELVS